MVLLRSLVEPCQNWYSTLESGRKRLLARSYRSDSGREPVREWLLSQNVGKCSAKTSRTLSFHGPSAWLVRPLGRELKSGGLPGGRIARVLFCVERDGMVLLHGFIKKTQKPPQHEIDLALKQKRGDDT